MKRAPPTGQAFARLGSRGKESSRAVQTSKPSSKLDPSGAYCAFVWAHLHLYVHKSSETHSGRYGLGHPAKTHIGPLGNPSIRLRPSWGTGHTEDIKTAIETESSLYEIHLYTVYFFVSSLCSNGNMFVINRWTKSSMFPPRS